MESLNLDLLLNAYKEEGKTKDTSMEPLIVFSDDEEGDPICPEQSEIVPDIESDWEKPSLPNKLNGDHEEIVLSVENVKKEEEEGKEAKGIILPLMLVVLV